MKQQKIKLKLADKKYLNIKQKEKLTTRVTHRVQILQMADKGIFDTAIAKALSIGRTTVWRTINRFLDHGIKMALEEQPRPGQPVRHTAKQDTSLIALACTDAPSGHKRWTVRLLAETAKKQKDLPKLCHESIRLLLQEQDCKPWLKKNVVYR
jgi:transposase